MTRPLVESMELPGKIPPHNLEAERALLGGALLDTADGYVARLIAAEDPGVFYKEAHRTMASEIRAMAGRNQPVDLLTLAEALRAAGTLEECGGPAYLSTLVEEATVATQAAEYVRMVREHAVRRSMIQLGRGLLEEGYEAAAPPAQALGRHMAACLKLEQGAAPDEILTPVQFAIDYATTEDPPAIETGIRFLDTFAGGARCSNITLLAGRPGLGKTTLAVQAQHHVSMVHKIPSLLLSLDMRRREIADRLLALEADLPLPRPGRSPLRDNPPKLAEVLRRLGEESGVHIADPTAPTLPQVQALVRRGVVKYGVRFVIVDYLGKIVGRGGPNKTLEVTEIVEGLRVTTRQLELPMLLLCQLNREPERRESPRPRNSDLRDSGSIEQESAVILFVWSRDDVERHTDPQEVFLTLGKNRFGEIGERSHLFMRSLGKITPTLPGGPR